MRRSLIAVLRQHLTVLLLLLIAVTAIAAFVLPAGLWRQIPVFLLLWIWPALTWSRILPGNRAERLLSAAGLSILLNLLLALLLYEIPGPIPRWALWTSALFVGLAPLAYAHRPPLPAAPVSSTQKRRFLWLAALVLLLALLFRLPGLGYKELQGDEGIVMVRAAAALTGDDLELFLHQKGPAEILVPLTTWGLTGAISELWIRLPFTWAAWLGVAALIALAYSWIGPVAALAAGLLFAINGFAIAFAHIAQYQSLVVLWGALALRHAHRYRQRGQALDLFLAAIFLAGGLLAHYDAILVAPAVAWLLLARLWDTRGEWHIQQLYPWALSALAAAFILALFYVPYVLSPTFASTRSYLLGDRIGGDTTSWSIPIVWRIVTFYNSTYYVVGLLALVLVGVYYLLRRDAGSRPRPPAIALLLYLAVPLLFYTVVVADPRTHVYTIFPGAALVAAAGLDSIWRLVPGRPARLLLGVALALFLAVSAFYVYSLFLDVPPERQRTWAENRPPLNPATWEEPPQYGLFGFPYQAGWRLAPALTEGLPYASNEEEEITDWYMGQAQRTHCANFESFILAENVQDPVAYDSESLAQRHLQHVVTVNGQPAMHIYGQSPVANVTRHEATGTTLWRTPAEVAPPPLAGSYPVGVTLGDRVRLRGYDLDTEQAYPGGQVTVTLYWEALAPLERNYQAFVHLYDGTLYAQHDSAPDCAIRPTTGWEPGEIIPDPHVLSLPTDMPLGPVPVLAGMYDLISEERLPVAAENNLVPLTSFEVRPVPSSR